MHRAVAAFSILMMFLAASASGAGPLPARGHTEDSYLGQPEDREIWRHLIGRLDLTEEQQKLLLRRTAEFKEDVVPFIRQLEECSQILRRLKANNGDPALIRRAENCILDTHTAIKRLFSSFVQSVLRNLTEEQQPALRQVIEVLLVIFDINLPPF